MAEAVKHIPSPPQAGHISEFELGRREPSLLFLLAVARLSGVPMELLVDDEMDLPERGLPNSSMKVRRKSVKKGGSKKSRPRL
jgi:transcriptional regulator with XRE-family HTH domain